MIIGNPPRAQVIGLPPAHKENKVQSEAMKVPAFNLSPLTSNLKTVN